MNVMKVSTYNVMSGGFEGYEQAVKDPKRFPLIVDAVATIKADVIGLVDTFRWVDIFSKEQLQKTFAYKEVFHTNLEDSTGRHDKRLGITLMSKLPVKSFESKRLGTRNCIKATIDVGGKPATFYLVYLEDLNPEIRMAQIKSLVDVSEKERAVIMGDFNSFRLQDVPRFEARWEGFLARRPEFKNREDYLTYFIPAQDGMKRGDVYNLITNTGYKDVTPFDSFEPTMPTPLFFEQGVPFLKVDYIFHTPDIVSSNAKVLVEGIFRQASDHYPLVADLSQSNLRG
jgi:endonuclease/exonuclease/phosphatase family metal-dependent hydrolase